MPARQNQYDLSIIVPCYQDELHLKKNVSAIYSLLNKSIYRFEMILVDDCSSDCTRDKIFELSKEFPNIKYLFHEKNTGRGGAFLDGSALAEGKYIGFLDIDLEVSCNYLLPVLIELDNGADLVLVRRHYALSPDPSFIMRHILSIGYKFVVHHFLKIPRLDTETGFKFFQRKCLIQLASQTQNKHWFFDTEIVTLASRAGYRIKEVQGLFIRRADKKSTLKVVRDTIVYIKELINFKKRLTSALVRSIDPQQTDSVILRNGLRPGGGEHKNT